MKRRSDSAFGLHFDFHASPAPGRVVGATLKEEDIREICTLLHPDFIQIDCKGHPGWASYPTALENPMPEIAFDTLELWRRVTREEDVALYLHYSGVMDERYCQNHPDDAVMNPDGTRKKNITRTMGPYADKLLIPQFKELAGKYGIDGVWVDGECWATALDYHPDTIAAFEKEVGIDLNGKPPVKRGDAYFNEFREFNRELFRRYVRHYVDEVHAEYPDFQIASNWAYTDHMPEEVSSNVDFLSGDFNPWNSFNVARYAGRAIAQQNRTWDLMAWNFRSQIENKPGGLPKHPVQIMQEAAIVLAVGGGFQNYITQQPDGSPRMDQIRRMKPVAEFIRARQPFCFRGKAVHEAAILLSTHNRHIEAGGLFTRCGYEKTVGTVALFCDAGQLTEVVSEHTLRGHCGNYKLIVLPDLPEGLEDNMIKELIEYAKNGGSLLLTGVNTCRMFAAHLPFSIEDTDRSGQWRYAAINDYDVGYFRDAFSISADNAEAIVWYGEAHSDAPLAGLILPYGKGKIGAVPANLGDQYYDCMQFMYRKVIRNFCDKLYPSFVKIENAVGLLEIVALKKDGKLCIQLVNANGNHMSTSSATEDFIPPVVDITLRVALDNKPESVMLQPAGKALSFDYADETLTVNIDRVDIHEIVEII